MAALRGNNFKEIMDRLDVSSINAAIDTVSAMSKDERQHALDTVQKWQAPLYDEIISLGNTGATVEQQEVLIELLLIIQLALISADIELEAISRLDYEKQLSRYIGHHAFIEGLSEKDSERATKDYVDTHSETALLAFAIKLMTVAGFTDNNDDVSKHLLLSGVSLVNSIAMAKSQVGGSASLAKQ